MVAGNLNYLYNREHLHNNLIKPVPMLSDSHISIISVEARTGGRGRSLKHPVASSSRLNNQKWAQLDVAAFMTKLKAIRGQTTDVISGRVTIAPSWPAIERRECWSP